MAYNTDLRFCSTVGDLCSLAGLKNKNLVRADTFRLMSTAKAPRRR